jgi:hypothetical protein
MDGLKFSEDCTVQHEGPNETVGLFLKDMLPSWKDKESILISHREIDGI